MAKNEAKLGELNKREQAEHEMEDGGDYVLNFHFNDELLMHSKSEPKHLAHKKKKVSKKLHALAKKKPETLEDKCAERNNQEDKSEKGDSPIEASKRRKNLKPTGPGADSCEENMKALKARTAKPKQEVPKCEDVES